MSEYFYWRYRMKLAGSGRLNAQTAGDEVEGALLRDQDGGHACLQPWPTLGQGDLESSLGLLRVGGESDLLASCRRCMALDGGARAAGIDLFEGKLVPQSHLTVPDWADFAWSEEKFSAGFTLFKLKCGVDFRNEARRVRELVARFGGSLRLRLDFNECLDLGAFEAFVGLLGGAAGQIDFVEDPVPFDAGIWGKLSRRYPFELAVDRGVRLAGDSGVVRVVKPAWETTGAMPGRVVFTSAMDHPVGQVFAAYEAAVFDGDLDDCGLLTHWLFEGNEFADLLGVEERRLVVPGGVGLGYGELLDALPWRAL